MKNLIEIFEACRSAQRSYFNDRSPENLSRAKDAEARADKAIKEFKGGDTDMFQTGHIFTDEDVIGFARFTESNRVQIQKMGDDALKHGLRDWVAMNNARDMLSKSDEWVVIAKPNYKSSSGEIKQGVEMEGKYYAPKNDLPNGKM